MTDEEALERMRVRAETRRMLEGLLQTFAVGETAPVCRHGSVVAGSMLCINCAVYVRYSMPQPSDPYWSLEVLIRMLRIIAVSHAVGSLASAEARATEAERQLAAMRVAADDLALLEGIDEHVNRLRRKANDANT